MNTHGGGMNSHAATQVSLVHASDSVRTVLGGGGNNGIRSTSVVKNPIVVPSTSNSHYGTLQNIRMSKPPVRVVHHHMPTGLYHHPQQVHQMSNGGRPSHAIPTMSVQPMAPRTSKDYPNTQLKRQPAFTESTEFGTTTVKTGSSQEMLQRVRAVRRQVADEETELRRLRELEHETNMLRERNSNREKELAVENGKLKDEQTVLREATIRVRSLTKHLEEMYKRRQTAAAAALVEHRKLQQQQINRQQQQQQQEVIRPRASVEPFQVSNNNYTNNSSEEFVGDKDGLSSKIPAEPPYQAPLPRKENMEEASSSPPRDQSPSPMGNCNPCLSTFAPPSFEQKINSSTINRNSPSSNIIERPTSFADSLDESRLRSGKTDLVSLRADSLKATKRRSWAASEGTSMSEAEMIHRLLDEQRRGKSHFIPKLPTPLEEPAKTLEVSPPVAPSVSAEPQQVSNPEPQDTTTEEEVSSCSARSDDEQNLEMEVLTDKRGIKGILRRPNEKMMKGRIRFDPLALLLDAAMEGELDLVRISAGKLDDVSKANDEGITALHNAICAGHYDIVRFLIEKGADVNAQDSDGWAPLHCAASCNNLPMVRQLVEGGGCVLATTLSDMETPVEKCEEEEDGYDGCLKYLVAAHNLAGTINDGKVYATYPYDAEYDDELSFEAGDELVVLGKDEVDRHWWKCRKTIDGEIGLVPRTYLALYPALKYRKRLNFVMFDLPLESNNNIIE